MVSKSKRISFGSLIKSEYEKIFFLRSTKVYLGLVIIMSLIMGLIFSLTTSVTQGRAITELAPIDVISANMLGIDVATIMLIIFTALSISREFTIKLINISLAATPNRKRFYLGKLVTYFILTLIISIVVGLLNYFASQIILISNGLPTVSLLDNSLRQFVLGSMVMPVFYSLLTVAAIFIFRNSGGAITFSLGVMLIPGLINMLSDNIQMLIKPILPVSSLHSLSGIAEVGSFEVLGVATSIIILIAWVFITSLVGIFQFERNDM